MSEARPGRASGMVGMVAGHRQDPSRSVNGADFRIRNTYAIKLC